MAKNVVEVRVDMRRCQTCRHWDQRNDLPAGKCERIPDLNGDDSWPPQVEIRSDDGFAYLWTPADFGCVLHEPSTASALDEVVRISEELGLYQEPTEETP